MLLLASNDELNRIDNEQFNSEANSDLVGICLIVLDVTFIVASFCSLIAVAYLFHLKMRQLGVNVKIGPSAEEDEDNAESHKTETTTLIWQQNTQSALNSAENKNRSRLVSGHLKNQKSHRTKVVEKIQQDHKNHRQKAIDQIKKKQSTRRSSLIQKVAARKKAKHSKALLNSIYFSNLEEASISKIIDAMDFVALDQNDDSEICRQGDVADTFYIIISGACQVTIDGRPITLLGALDSFGEIALFTGASGQSVRSATVRKMVDKDLQLLTLSRAKFNALIASGTLNESCMNKLKLLAEQRKKEHMPMDQAPKQDRQLEQGQVTEQKNNGQIPAQLVDKYRLLLGKTIKTSFRFRRVIFKLMGNSLSIGGCIDGNTIVNKKMFLALAKNVLVKKHKINVNATMMEGLWVSACCSSNNGGVVDRSCPAELTFGSEKGGNSGTLSCLMLENWLNISL